MDWIGSATHSRIDSFSENVFDEDNGYVLCDVYFPSEVVALILSFVDNDTLVEKGRYVCKEWNELIKTVVWKLKAEREYSEKFMNLNLTMRLPWSVYHDLARKTVFEKNLLKNNCGQDGLKHWEILDPYGVGWKVESPPIGVTIGLYRGIHRSCFVTSYMESKKSQLIDLCSEGIHPDILDKFQPDIFISECFAPRRDCGSYYEIQVQLLDEEKKIMDQFDFNKTMEPATDGWAEIRYTFESSGPGVRYVLFTHAGKDTQFWAGEYGSKMTDGCVEVRLQ